MSEEASIIKFVKLLAILSLFASFASKANTPHLVFASIDIVHISEPHPDYNSGLAIELLDQMSQSLNFTYEVNFYPLSRGVDLVRRGKADGFIGIYYSDKRAEFMDYSQVVLYQDEMRLFSKPSLDFDWGGDGAQLKDKRIALVRGGAYGEVINKNRHYMQVVEVNSVDQQFKLLDKGRIDLTAYNTRTAPIAIARLQLTGKFISHQPALDIRRGYFAFAKRSKHKDMLKQFDQFLLQLEKTGELKALQQHFNPQ